MVTETDKLLVETEVNLRGAKKASEDLSNLSKGVVNLREELKKAARELDNLYDAIGAKAKFNQKSGQWEAIPGANKRGAKTYATGMRNLSSGGPEAAYTNARMAGTKAQWNAAHRSEYVELQAMDAAYYAKRERAHRNFLINKVRDSKTFALAETEAELKIQREGLKRRKLDLEYAATTTGRMSGSAHTTWVNTTNQLKQVEAELKAIKDASRQKKLIAQEEERAANKAAKAKEREARAAEKAAAAGQKGYNRVGNLLGDGGASLFAIQTQLRINYALQNAFVGLFQGGAQYIVEFDEALYNLQAVAAATASEMQTMSNTIINVANQTKFTAVEVAEAAVTLAQAGFTVKQIEQSLSGVAMLATASGSSLATSVDVASSTISVFEMRAEDMTHVTNVLTQALNDTKLTIDKYALSIQYAGNIAHEAGMTFEETTAILGAMSNAGIRSGSTLGTGLRQVITALMSPSDKLKNKIHQLGLNIEELDIQARGIVPVLETLKQAGFSSADAFEVMEVRSAAAFAAMSKNPELIEQLQRNFILTTAAVKANETQMRSFANLYKNLQSVMGNTLNTALKPTLEVLKALMKALTDFFVMLNEHQGALQVLGAAFVSLLAGNVVAQVARLTAGIIGLGKAFTAMAGAATLSGKAMAGLRLLINPVGAAVAAAAIGVWHLANANKELAKLDGFKGQADTSRGDLESTRSTMTALNEARSRINERSATLRSDSSGLRTEALGLQIQFASLGARFDTLNPSVDSVAKELDRLSQILLRQEERELSDLREAQGGIIDNTPLGGKFTKIVNPQNWMAKLIQYGLDNSDNAEAAAKYRAQGIEARTKRYSSAEQEFISQAEHISHQMAQLRNENKGVDLTPKQLQALGNSMMKAYEEINHLMQGAENTETGFISLAGMIKSAKAEETYLTKTGEDPKRLKQVKEEFERLMEVKAFMVGQQTEILQSAKAFADQADVLSESQINAISQTSIAAAIQQEISKTQQLISQKNKELGETTGVPERKVIEDSLVELRDKIKTYTSTISQYQVDTVIEELRKSGLQVDEKSVRATLEGIVNSAAGLANEVAQMLQTSVGRSISYAKNQLDKAARDFKIQQSMAQLSELAMQRQTSYIDGLQSRASDRNSNLWGKFSDTEIDRMTEEKQAKETEMLELQEKNLQSQMKNIKLQIDAATVLTEAYQRQLAANPNDPEAISQVLQAEEKLNDLVFERLNFEEKIKQLRQDIELNKGNADPEGTLEERFNRDFNRNVSKLREDYSNESSWLNNMMRDMTAVVGTAHTSLSSFFQDVLTGTKSVSAAFRDMAVNILQSMLKISTDRLAANIMSYALGAIPTLGGAQASYARTSARGASNPGSFGPGFNRGGIIKANRGAHVARDNQLIMAQSGEYVLRSSAVDMIGKDNLDKLNALGNTRYAASSNIPTAPGATAAAGGPTLLNVYVVTPDQKPGMTQNDVVVAVTDDLLKGGPIKKLVKTIAVGG